MSAASGALTTMLHSPSDVRVASLFTRAVDTVGVVERHYTIAGLCVTMRFAGEPVLRAWRLHSSTWLRRPRRAGLTVNLWDSASSGVEAPPLLGDLVESDESGSVYYYERDGVQAMGAGERSRCSTGMRPKRGSGHPIRPRWLRGTGRRPPGDPALVARLARRRAGARRRNRHGGGRGARRRTRRLGEVDDALSSLAPAFATRAMTSSPSRPTGAKVHSLYCSGKLDAGASNGSSACRPRGEPVRGRGREGDRLCGRRVSRERDRRLPLRACWYARRRPRARDTGVPVSGAAALTALAPSTIFQLFPPATNALAEMAALVRAVPCYSLELGSEIERILRGDSLHREDEGTPSVSSCRLQQRGLPRADAGQHLRLEYEPFEVIVVDDGSADASASIAQSYPGLRYIHQENRGPAAARNAGIEAARGEFVAFVDSDDIVLPHKLLGPGEVPARPPDVTAAIGRQEDHAARTVGIAGGDLDEI